VQRRDPRRDRSEIVERVVCLSDPHRWRRRSEGGTMVSMTTFVLVHPAWFGGWCWQKIVPRLRAAGHEVRAPTLTGLGERAHLAAPLVGLNVHVDDVVQVLRFVPIRWSNS
jgi:hypothetical protein